MRMVTKHGVFGIASSDSGDILIRSPYRSHLERLIELCPELQGVEVLEYPDKQPYPFRLIVDRLQWIAAAANLAADVDYRHVADALAVSGAYKPESLEPGEGGADDSEPKPF